MHTLARKLKSTRGASMLFALLVFLLCLLAGTAVLTGAAANIGRYTHLEGEQQQGQLSGSTPPVRVEVKYTKTETWQYGADLTSPPNLVTTYTLKLDPDVLPDTLGYYQKLLLVNCVPQVWHDNAAGNDSFSSLQPGAAVTFPSASAKSYTVTLDGADPAWHVCPVDVAVKDPTAAVDAGPCPLVMELRAEAENGAAAYPLRVVWPGKVTTETNTTVETVGNIEGITPSVDGSGGTRTTTTTLICTLTWNAEDRVVTFIEP